MILEGRLIRRKGKSSENEKHREKGNGENKYWGDGCLKQYRHGGVGFWIANAKEIASHP